MQILRLARVELPIVAYMLFLFGVLLAVSSGATFAFDRFIWGSGMVLAAALSVNYGNDYFDVEVDRLNETSPISGGSGILLKNPELRNLAKWIAISLMSISIALSVAFTAIYRLPAFLISIVVAGNSLIWFYSAPPLRLSCRGLGEVTTMLAAGLMLPCLGYFIMLGNLNGLFWIFSVPFVLYALSMIVSVEMPDMEGDRRGRKETLIVRRGRRFGFIVIALSNIFATLYISIVSVSQLVPMSVDSRLIAVLSLPPLVTGFLGLRRMTELRELATRLVTLNVRAISSMLLMIDCYFVLTLI